MPDGDLLFRGAWVVDLHTHLREPGAEHKETVETGTRAAAAGGYTAVAPMANTDPVADDASVIAEVSAAAVRAGLTDVFPVGAITKGLDGPVGRARARGQTRRPPGHRRGDPAPPRADGRSVGGLRHEPQGESTAPLRGGPRRAPRRPGRRDDRCDRHRSRAACRRGEGRRVRPGTLRDDRPRDRARGGAHGARGPRHDHADAGDRGHVERAGEDPRRSRARGPDRARTSGEPRRVRSGGALDRRGAVRLEGQELGVPRPRADGSGAIHAASGRAHRGGGEGHEVTAPEALLVLEDGTAVRGAGFGAQGESFGEAVFNTGMAGYQEVLTDPSYAGQIVTMTAPQQGNYGVNAADAESSAVRVSGFVVREAARRASSWRAEGTLRDALAASGVVSIEGVDTRMLTRRIRETGAMRAAISTVDLDAASLLARVRGAPGMAGADLAGTVTAD